jgi:hypothetical protein
MTRVAAHAVSSRLLMKRLLPFIIIVFVGLATVGGALIFYRAKMQPLAAAVPPPKPTHRRRRRVRRINSSISAARAMRRLLSKFMAISSVRRAP